MAEKKRFGLRDIRALAPASIIYDSDVLGFAAQRQKDAVSYVLRYRTADGRQRWFTIGRHGSPWTPDQAREEAKRILGDVAKGLDPSGLKQARRDATCVADLCDAYVKAIEEGRLLTRSGRAKKPNTLTIDKGRINAHIKPLLGTLPVAALTRQDVQSFMHAVAEGKTAKSAKTTKRRGLANVRGGKGTATKALSLLSAIMTYAIDRGLRTDNPATGVRKFAEGRRERRLSDTEYAALGKALREQARAKNIWPPAIAAIRLLTLTGWRRGEALNLTPADVELAKRTAILPETKTGKSMRPLSRAACDVLREVPTIAGNKFMFPPSRGEGNMQGFRSYWLRIAKLAELPAEVTPHTLRHSFASLAADLGYSEPTIGALIGHKGQTITSRYIHSADALLLAAADAVAKRTAELMGDEPSGAAVAP
ncbi:MAG: hypothetical protein JWR10_851 [Rubritepida sp.]|nr:hypothetical protein [Rubritepida sp.]